MTNYEYFKDEILNVCERTKGSFAISNSTGRIVGCRGLWCSECKFGESRACGRDKMKWLYAEHIEKPKLTKKERQFCELVETGCLCRDEDGALYHYIQPVTKLNLIWKGYSDIHIDKRFPGCNFSFITWDDKEPWSVEELLKLEVCDE